MSLYKVVYGLTENKVQAQYQRSYKDWLIDQWLEDNCERGYYHSPGWTTEKYIQFQSELDATLFALRWA